MVHVRCWPRSAGATGHHVCPRACSNADFQHTKPYRAAVWQRAHMSSCGQLRAVNSPCRSRWAAPLAVGGGWRWAAPRRRGAGTPCEFAPRIRRAMHTKREIAQYSNQSNCFSSFGAWNLSLSVFQAMTHNLSLFHTQSNKRLK